MELDAGFETRIAVLVPCYNEEKIRREGGQRLQDGSSRCVKRQRVPKVDNIIFNT